MPQLRGQACAVIQLCAMESAPGWSEPPEHLAQRWCSSFHPGLGGKQLGTWGLGLKGALGTTYCE